MEHEKELTSFWKWSMPHSGNYFCCSSAMCHCPKCCRKKTWSLYV